MFVEKVHLKNFTVFRDCEINFSKGVNVIIGENGTGKTSLLKLINSLDEKFYTRIKINVFEVDIKGLIYPLVNRLLLNKYTEKERKDDFDIASQELLESFENKNSDKNLRLKKADDCRRLLFWHCMFNDRVKFRNRPILSISNTNLTIKHSLYRLELFNDDNSKEENDLFDGGIKYIFEDKQFTYIPCKDILTNSRAFLSLYNTRQIAFESVYYNILTKAMLPQLNGLNPKLKELTDKIENAIGGVVIQKDEVFFINYKDIGEIPFSMVAEGHKKLALLWLLIKNGSIDKDTVLLFDEPESNLNPQLVDVMVEVLLSLSRLGCQIFIATHNNFIVEDFSIKAEKEDNVLYHSLYFDKDKSVNCETKTDPNLLLNNALNDKINEQYNATIGKVLGGDK